MFWNAGLEWAAAWPARGSRSRLAWLGRGRWRAGMGGEEGRMGSAASAIVLPLGPTRQAQTPGQRPRPARATQPSLTPSVRSVCPDPLGCSCLHYKGDLEKAPVICKNCPGGGLPLSEGEHETAVGQQPGCLCDLERRWHHLVAGRSLQEGVAGPHLPVWSEAWL